MGASERKYGSRVRAGRAVKKSKSLELTACFQRRAGRAHVGWVSAQGGWADGRGTVRGGEPLNRAEGSEDFLVETWRLQ